MKLVSYDARSRRRSPELTLIDALFSLSTDNVESEPHRVTNTVSITFLSPGHKGERPSVQGSNQLLCQTPVYKPQYLAVNVMK